MPVTDSTIPEGVGAAEYEALRRAAKDELRRRAAALRRTLVSATRSTHSAAVCAALTSLDVWVHARSIAGYVALRFEVDPAAALEHVMTRGTQVALPRVVGSALTLHRVASWAGLLRSPLGIEEPAPDAPDVDPATVDVVLVPAIAYDPRGYRLGFGHGYYDRFLPRCTRAVKVGLCYELSLLAEIPETSDDVPVDVIVTERRVIRCRS